MYYICNQMYAKRQLASYVTSILTHTSLLKIFPMKNGLLVNIFIFLAILQ
jgi:hypothetical protein